MAAPTIVSVVPVAFWPETILRITFSAALDPAQANSTTASTYTLTGTSEDEHTVIPRSAVLSAAAVIDLYCYGVPNGNYTLTTTAPIYANANPDPLPTGSTKAVVANGQPSGRVVALDEMIASMHWSRDDSGDLARFIKNILQPILDELLVYIDRWTDIIDPDLAPETFLDDMLTDLGNPFLTVVQKRALVQTLIPIYRQTGTAAGIENVIRFFLGINATVYPVHKSSWKLGTDKLGTETVLSSANVIYTFDIILPAPASAFEEKAITWIANRMKVSHEHFRRIVV